MTFIEAKTALRKSYFCTVITSKTPRKYDLVYKYPDFSEKNITLVAWTQLEIIDHVTKSEEEYAETDRIFGSMA